MICIGVFIWKKTIVCHDRLGTSTTKAVLRALYHHIISHIISHYITYINVSCCRCQSVRVHDIRGCESVQGSFERPRDHHRPAGTNFIQKAAINLSKSLSLMFVPSLSWQFVTVISVETLTKHTRPFCSTAGLAAILPLPCRGRNEPRSRRRLVRKAPFWSHFEPFWFASHLFAKTGLGQT